MVSQEAWRVLVNTCKMIHQLMKTALESPNRAVSPFKLVYAHGQHQLQFDETAHFACPPRPPHTPTHASRIQYVSTMLTNLTPPIEIIIMESNNYPSNNCMSRIARPATCKYIYPAISIAKENHMYILGTERHINKFDTLGN